MASVQPVCRRSKSLPRAKPRERTKYIYYDTDPSARHTVAIKPRSPPPHGALLRSSNRTRYSPDMRPVGRLVHVERLLIRECNSRSGKCPPRWAPRRMWSGFSSEIETHPGITSCVAVVMSHVERL